MSKPLPAAPATSEKPMESPLSEDPSTPGGHLNHSEQNSEIQRDYSGMTTGSSAESLPSLSRASSYRDSESATHDGIDLITNGNGMPLAGAFSSRVPACMLNRSANARELPCRHARVILGLPSRPSRPEVEVFSGGAEAQGTVTSRKDRPKRQEQSRSQGAAEGGEKAAKKCTFFIFSGLLEELRAELYSFVPACRCRTVSISCC